MLSTVNVFYRRTPDGVEVQFSYDAELVACLKDAAPSFARRWDADGRAWHIDAAYWPDVRRALLQAGVTLMERPADPQLEESATARLAAREAALRDRERELESVAAVLDVRKRMLDQREAKVVIREKLVRMALDRNTSGGPYDTLYLLPSAPLPVMEAVYRALVKLYHPDAGGDTQKMARINAAWDQIKGKRR